MPPQRHCLGASPADVGMREGPAGAAAGKAVAVVAPQTPCPPCGAPLSRGGTEFVSAVAVAPVVARVLEQVTLAACGRVCPRAEMEVFRAQQLPGISLAAYCHRIARYSLISGEALVLALVYIDRLILSHPGAFVSALNVHRLILTACMVAAKFFDEEYATNSYYARVGGVSPREVSLLEVDFLFLCGGFDLYTSEREFSRYLGELRGVASVSLVPERAPVSVEGWPARAAVEGAAALSDEKRRVRHDQALEAHRRARAAWE